MAEYGYNEDQTLQPGAAALLLDIEPCTRCPQLVIHDNLTPNLTLRGIARNMNCCNPKARYNVEFSANFTLAEGATVGPIQLALSVNGYVRPFTISAATPAAVGDYWHAEGSTNIDVPAGCCTTVTVVNASESATPGTTPAPAVTVRNLNVTVSRIAA